MGYEDTLTKQYFSRNEIFADAFNYLIYDGEQKIHPDDLQEMDTTEIVLPFGADYVKEPTQKYRDVLKTLTMQTVGMTDSRAAYLILGIEEQTNVHYAMPVKDMLYDSMNYARQVERANRSYRRNMIGKRTKENSEDEKYPEKVSSDKKYRLKRDEFLSGFRKCDRLLPVITLVVYMGAEEWDAPTSIYEMFSVQDDKLLKYVADYRINLIAPSRMSEDAFDKFHTGLGAALQCIKHSKDDSMSEMIRSSEKYRRIDRASADIINELTKSGYEYEEERGYVDMCIAVENDRRRAREEGLLEGIEKGIEQGIEQSLVMQIQKKLAKGKYAEVIAEELETDIDTIRTLISRLQEV